MSLIIVEGVDGTGKTVLAKKMSKIHNIPVVNIFDNSDKNILNEMSIEYETYHEDIYFIENWLNLKRPNCILDRSVLSGLVYDDKNSRAYMALGNWMKRIEQCKNEIEIVFLDALPGKVIERDNDWKDKKNELNSLSNSFAKLYNLLKGFGIKVYWIDTTFMNENNVFSEIAKKREEG